MSELIIDAWTAAVTRLCQFTVDHLPPILAAGTVDVANIHAVLSATSSTKSLLTLFEQNHNESVARIIAGKCEFIFNFWASHVAVIPASAASQLGRIEKLFHLLAHDVAPPLTDAARAG